jgi:hypothetical protein
VRRSVGSAVADDPDHRAIRDILHACPFRSCTCRVQGTPVALLYSRRARRRSRITAAMTAPTQPVTARPSSGPTTRVVLLTYHRR